jgi:hypothetical protein
MEHKLKIQEDENERLSKSLVDFDGSKMELILSSRNAEALNGEVLKLRDQNSKYVNSLIKLRSVPSMSYLSIMSRTLKSY